MALKWTVNKKKPQIFLITVFQIMMKHINDTDEHHN